MVNTDTPRPKKKSKRKVISPIQGLDLESSADDEANEDTISSCIVDKLDAFQRTFDMNMDMVTESLKIKISDELQVFKREITEKINKSDKEYKERMGTMEEKIVELEKSLDIQSQEIEELKKENHELLKKMQLYEGMICSNEKDTEYIKEDILQIQAKSMSANLVFHSIPEEDTETSDTTAQILKQFFTNELKILTPDLKLTEMDKVHRFGRKMGKKPRPIVAKFLQSKGKEIVLRHAKNLDKSKKFGISEQQNRKQSLMPRFKEARAKSQKSRWLNDKLLVEDRLISAHQDKVRDINMNVVERAMELKAKSAPPKTQQLSTFQGHAILITCQVDIIPALRAVQADPRIARAEHNICLQTRCKRQLTGTL